MPRRHALNELPVLDLTSAKDELNLAEFPIAALSRHIPAGHKTLVFEDTITDQATGETITRRLTIAASEAHGLPTALDTDVIIALIQLTKLANNFTNPTVNFTRYQLIQLLGWTHDGKSYRRLEEALRRWTEVTLHYKNAWREVCIDPKDPDKRIEVWASPSFSLIGDLILYETPPGARQRCQMSLPFSSFRWSDIIFRNFSAGHLKRLDYERYRSLQNPTSKQMYRFLDKRFHWGDRIDFDLHNFAFEHIGLSRGYDTGKIKEQLRPSIEELEHCGFLVPFGPEDRYVQIRRKSWRIVFARNRKQQPVAEPQSATDVTAKAAAPPLLPDIAYAPPAHDAPCPPPEGLAKELINRGVTDTAVPALLAQYSPERIAHQIDVFDWLVETKNRNVTKADNPAGYLIDSIRKNYRAPKGYQPKAERERLQKAAEEKQRQKRESERQNQVREEAERQRKGEHLGRIRASLNDAQLHEFERRARSEAAGLFRKYFHEDDAHSMEMRGHLIDRQILKDHPLPEPADH